MAGGHEQRLTVDHAVAAGLLRTGDPLLFRGRGAVSEIIRGPTRAVHSHAGMAWVLLLSGAPPWAGCLEMAEGKGGRLAGLRQYVAAYDGLIDVYRVDAPGFDAVRTVRYYLEHVINRPYGARSLTQLAMQYTPFARWFIHPSHDDDLPLDGNPFCSSSLSAALRAGGWDPVKNLADKDTSPGDLERADMEYQCTLAREVT